MQISLSDPIAVIADIHGNCDALKAVLADIDRLGVTQIINLGDHLSGPLAARETAEILFQRKMINIRGNHDRLLIEQNPKDMGPSDLSAFKQLEEEHLDWLRILPFDLTLSDEIYLCHGTPNSDNTYWLESVRSNGDIIYRPQAEVEAEAEGITCSLLLCGHTHIPRAARLNDERLIVNPGSVGLPAYDDDSPFYHVMQSGSPDARYAIVHLRAGQWEVSFRHIPYDAERMVLMAQEAGREDWAQALRTGWLST